MTTTAWDHLPNKIHIDQVLIDLKNHPGLFAKVWSQAWEHAWELAGDQAWEHARDQAGEQVRVQARIQVWKQAWEHARDQAWDKARDHALVQAYYVATNALLALIAYDDAGEYLTVSADQAMVYGELVSNGQYTLLKPYLLLKHEIALLATA
jgi:hypothetical protein